MKASNNYSTTQLKPVSPLKAFEVRTIQSIHEEAGRLNELSNNPDYFQLFWITQGTGTYINDLEKTSIQSNHVFCIKPGQMHKLSLDDNARGFVFLFTESFINAGELEFDLGCQSSFSHLFSPSAGIILQHEILNDMKDLVDKILKEFNNLFSFKTEILKRYFKIFLIYLTRGFEEKFKPVVQTRNAEMVQNFMRLLEKNFKEEKMVAGYARHLAVTPNYLNEVIKKNTGYCAGHHIRQRVILEAKRLAVYSDLSMKEIAYELGFIDPYHFSKFFKTVAGMNFSEFKRGAVIVPLDAAFNRA